MDYKTYNKIIIYIFVLLLFLVSFINYFINPYNVFNTNNSLNKIKLDFIIDKNQRFSKIPAMKLYKGKIDAIWVGSSRTWENSNEDYESKILQGKIKNLALSVSSLDESIIMAKNAIILHPEIKTIYFGIDFNAMNKLHTKNIESIKLITNSNDKKIKKEEFFPLIFSFSTLVDSIKTISKNINSKYKYGSNQQYNENIEYAFGKVTETYYKKEYKTYILDEEKFEQLKEFKKYVEKNGNIKIVFFVTAMHVIERILINETNNLENFYKFKEKLADIQPYYDFSILNEYTTEEIKPSMKYFKDAVHPSEILRGKITNKLFLNNNDVGVYITKTNIKDIIQNDKNNFRKFLKKNNHLVEFVNEWSK